MCMEDGLIDLRKGNHVFFEENYDLKVYNKLIWIFFLF